MKTDYGEYNAQMLKQLIRTRFSNQITQISQTRCLYAHQQILQALNFAFDYKFAKQTNIGKSYSLEYDNEAIDIDSASNVIFFIYPDEKMINVIASMIQKNQISFVKKSYYLYFVPISNFLCSEALEILNISNKIKIKNFNFDFIPLNNDLFSLEIAPHLDVIEEDQFVVESLLRMCNIAGKFKAFYGLGERSQQILKNFEKQQLEIPRITQNQSNSYLIVLDRSLDYVTPMLTAFSYQGLLDMFFGIKFNQVQVPGHLIQSQNSLQTFLLYNPKDKHYQQISKMYIRDIPEYLVDKSEKLSKVIKQEKLKAQGLQDLNKINQTLMGQYILLQYHKSIVTFLLMQINQCPFINTATLESSLIQDCQRAQNIQYLSLFYPIQQVLKLEILSSQVSQIGSYYSRFSKKITESILQAYHCKHLLTVNNLVNKKILKSSQKPLKWKQICDKYNLLPDNPHKYTYIHIIYSVLTVRFIDMFLTDNLNQQTIALLRDGSDQKNVGNKTETGYGTGSFKKVKSGDLVYVYFIGGVTYSEIQSLRILGEKMKIRFMICTTEVTSGQQIIKKCF